MRKPLVFSSVISVLIISIVLGIFIRQKIKWNNWETQQLLFHQKQIKHLVDAINKIEFNLKKEESKKNDLNQQNNHYRENISKLTEIIKSYDKEINRLENKNTSAKKAEKLVLLSDKSGRLKTQIKNTKDEVIELVRKFPNSNNQTFNRSNLMLHVLLTKNILESHHERISEYIDIRNDIETKINKHKENKEQKSKKLEEFQSEISKNDELLKVIISSIEKLKETLSGKRDELLSLKAKNS